MFILMFLSQIWISLFIWYPENKGFEANKKIFHGSLYESLLIEQSLMFQLVICHDKKGEDNMEEKKRKGKIPQVIGCATMWHETTEEMELLLHSVIKMTNVDKELLTWNLQIFFDDAFQEDGSVNKYVLRLFDAVNNVHKKRGLVPPQAILEDMPFGGNVTWELKKRIEGGKSIGGSKVICYLKDAKKIRKKKRWSQCMYFDFLQKKCGEDTKQSMIGKGKETDDYFSENTFILTLDGDVDFNPDAVIKLLELMQKNENIGAACGRIHPTGTGVIPLYQKFEYAIGHWLQKSTEDALGNVLCSPGCFSLFRLKSVIENKIPTKVTYLEDNGMKAYRKHKQIEELQKSTLEMYYTKTSQAKHSIQYDQGEDRWLSTLLIGRGWRVGYEASSHSRTASPESFDEFFNQRRRWSPSTVANLLDFISNWGVMLQNGNGNILHMAYQLLMISASALGPGGIFLMLIGGCHMVFEIGYWTSMALNTAVLLIFLISSLFDKYQLLVAKALGILYAILMLVIMVFLIIEAVRLRGTCSFAPTTFSLLLIVSFFLITGLMHPGEYRRVGFLILPGIIYYLTIPCMYMLLPFYCVFNLNDVSWGTRNNASNNYKDTTGSDNGKSGGLQNIVSIVREVVEGEKKKEIGKTITFH